MIKNFTDYKMIGQRIKFARIRKGITQETLAEKADVSVTHISNIETGRTKLSVDVLIKIANALTSSSDEILLGNIEPSATIFYNRFSNLLSDCTEKEALLVLESAKILKDVIIKSREIEP